MAASSTNIWTPAAEFPQHEAFYRRVLDQLPTPVIVVDDVGRIMYGNTAMIRLGPWSKADGLQEDLLSYIHPDDVSWVADAFTTLTSVESPAGPGGVWAPISLRLVSASGDVIPVQVTGCNRIEDPEIGGVLYHVQPVTDQAIERQVVAGLTNGADVDELLASIVDLVALPPLELAACVVGVGADGRAVVLAATGSKLRAVVDTEDSPTGWFSLGESTSDHAGLDTAMLGVDEHEAMGRAGFATAWRMPIPSTGGPYAYVVAASQRRHESAAGIEARLTAAANLAAAVLTREGR